VAASEAEAIREARAQGIRPGALSALLEELVQAPGGSAPSAWERALRPGAVVGRFELVRELGRGGFGVVYEARDRELGRAVAFKAIVEGERPHVREERLLAEADAAARLSHPNIVTLYDAGRSEHGPFLVLELLRGRTLAARLAAGRLGLRETLRVAVAVARGVAHAHAHGVVHRDLTPGNVFLCDDGQVKVLDLGMAHAFGRRKLRGGTPAYVAPEAWRGAPEDERSDVYGLGAVLYECLTGELPHAADRGRTDAGRPAPALDVPGAPALGDLVGRMLAPDPVDRPRDGAEVLAALLAIEEEVARTPSTSDAAPAVRRPRRWRRAALILGAAALLATVAAAAVVAARRGAATARAAPSIAVLPFADMSPEQDQAYFSEGLSEEILNALAQVEGLRVAGRTSSFAFKGHDEDLRAIGAKLGVGNVLEGSVRKAAGRVRITAQIVSVADGFHLWSKTFDRDLTDIFAVQDEIAGAVVAALKVKLLPGGGPPAKPRPPVNPEAYGQYLLGRQFYARYSPDGFRRAVDAFEKALALEPNYAQAWAALSIPLLFVGEHGGSQADKEATRRRAREAADRAIALDPELGEAYSARSHLRGTYDWDWKGAQQDMERAVALTPGDSNVQRRYGLLLGILGRREEAIAATRKAIEIDPLFPSNWTALGTHQLALGDLAAARRSWSRAVEIAPE
jgi:eukaryotic-like serine/threonine-protein kinase